MELRRIGVVKHTKRGAVIKIDEPYIMGMKGIEGFGHINVLWWFSGCEDVQSRNSLELKQPYRNAPETIGVFASRSPERPNPIALTASEILDVDFGRGEILVAFIDAEDGSPVLDIKPYIPSFGRDSGLQAKRFMPQWTSASGTQN